LAKIKDTDYLFLSTRVKALERNLLTRERMERMLEGRTAEDAAKVLQECGYGEMNRVGQQELDKMIADQRHKTMEDLSSVAPDPRLIDVFKIKYDYHNIKVLLKAEATGTNADRLLVEAGRVPTGQLADGMRTAELKGVSYTLRRAVSQAREVLSSTGDPQLADFVLDKAYFAEMFELSRATGSSFLEGYVRISIDAANLRSLVRVQRMGKGPEFLRSVLFEGGNIDVGRVLAASGGSIEELYAASSLRQAAEAGAAALNGGGLTRFEKLCDDGVNRYLSGAKYVAFGEAPVIGYLAAKENEYTAVRIILTGRMAGLDADTIRERLRESYV
jgi:V/A-type H+-transporting ATPase subunit C